MAHNISRPEASAEPQAVIFSPITRAYLPLVARWLAEPHVSAWWGDPDEQLALVSEDIDEPRMRGFLFSVGGVPAGYVQCFPAAAWPGHPFGDLAEGRTMAIDMFLGEPALLGRGHGSQALAAFAERLFAEGTERALIDPDIDNARAIKAYRTAGFVAAGTGIGDDGPALVMVKECG